MSKRAVDDWRRHSCFGCEQESLASSHDLRRHLADLPGVDTLHGAVHAKRAVKYSGQRQKYRLRSTSGDLATSFNTKQTP